MRAAADYARLVRQARESGADVIMVGAGLPLDLPELTADFPRVANVPILSDACGIALVMKKWKRRKRLPDAIIIEHPRHASGHLGAAAVQVGTAFAVTEEGDAHPEFKRVLAGARPEDIVEFPSVAGLPARAAHTPWLESYLDAEAKIQAKAAERNRPKPRCAMVFHCLAQRGLRDGIARFGQFCIDNQLAAALKGDVKRGLFFRGAGRLPFGSDIRSVRELIDHLLGSLFQFRYEPGADGSGCSQARRFVEWEAV